MVPGGEAMDGFNPDSYCGIYCGACSIVKRATSGHADPFAACLGAMASQDLACGGCKSDSVYAGCRTCRVRPCAREKGLTHCADCAEYPCTLYRRWQSVATVLDHVTEAPRNLEAIKRDGALVWLAAQKRRWSCPDCGAPFSWYARDCHQCGRELSPQAYALSGWGRLLCRIVLPMAYRKGKRQRPAAR
jgi:hypothetical protein